MFFVHQKTKQFFVDVAFVVVYESPLLLCTHTHTQQLHLNKDTACMQTPALSCASGQVSKSNNRNARGSPHIFLCRTWPMHCHICCDETNIACFDVQTAEQQLHVVMHKLVNINCAPQSASSPALGANSNSDFDCASLSLTSASGMPSCSCPMICIASSAAVSLDLPLSNT